MAKPIKTHKKRRLCRLASCKRQLSIYNGSTYCNAHQHHALNQRPASAASR